MENKEITKEYSNGELTIVWKPQKCIHAAECVHTLPNVYRPKAKPWIQADQATTDELIAQIAKCPSGALSYYMNEQQGDTPPTSDTNIQVIQNGPLLVQGTLNVSKQDGTIEIKNGGTAFCRCGASKNKPYCDGAHKKIGFTDE